MTDGPTFTARAVFLDSEGTLIRALGDRPDADRVELLPRVGESLRRLQDAGYLLVVVSNQPGVAMGRYPAGSLSRIESRLDEQLAEFGVIITGFGWCPHFPPGARATGAFACECRKPRPGLLMDASATHAIALGHSWMIGDVLDDVEAGLRAGCRAVLIDRGMETRWRAGRLRTPTVIVYDFADAVSFVLESGHGRRVANRSRD